MQSSPASEKIRDCSDYFFFVVNDIGDIRGYGRMEKYLLQISVFYIFDAAHKDRQVLHKLDENLNNYQLNSEVSEHENISENHPKSQ